MNVIKRNPPRRQRQAIVLLVVLGMLSLFSVLIVTYVVFSSQMRQAAHGNALRQERLLQPEAMMDSVIRQIVAGGSVKSAAFGQDLLGDLYGIDHVQTRVAHRRSNTVGTYPGDSEPAAPRAVLLQPPAGTNARTTLFKFPLHFANWHDDGVPPDPMTRQLRNEVVYKADFNDAGNLDPATTPAVFRQRLTSRRLPDYRLSDAFTGRLLTFQQGPLKGRSFRIVQYFGSEPLSGNESDAALAGCVVIDLAESSAQAIDIAGRRRNLMQVAATDPNLLVYGPGPNNVHQGGNPLSDDIGYRILINGVPFNGRGHNAAGVNAITRGGTTVDPSVGPELLPNRRITGPIDQINEPNELYDAADFENWFLAWQPADHRGVLPEHAAVLAGQLGISTAEAMQAAPHIVPSFHRPEVINYLMNQPIRLNPNDPEEPLRRFADLDGNDDGDLDRLYLLIRRLRAATYRPLNFGHVFRNAASSDLNGDGSPHDGAPRFSGSNPVPILNQPIEANAATPFALLRTRVQQLAVWLCNGPWDVDNDGSGIPDSIWTDFDLPTQTIGNGAVVKPLVAALIEDLDGRINLNAAGNYAQLTHRRFNAANPTAYNNDLGYLTANNALKFFNRGGGIGPADINFVHLFDERYNTPPYVHRNPNNSVPPLFYSQTSPPGTSVLQTRYGNILQSRYGGVPWDYRSPLNATNFPIAHPGQNVGAMPFRNFSDPFSRLLLPSRRHLHVPTGTVARSIAGVNETVDSPMGRPIDMFGRSTIRKGRGGNATMDEVGELVTLPQPALQNTTVSEIVNQPYEFEVDEPIADDRPFTAAEFHALVERGSATALSERLVDLLGDATASNEALSRLLTFESRSLDTVELPGGQTVAQFVIERMPDSIRNNPSAVNTQIQRMLAVELRKGSKLNLNRPLRNEFNAPNDARQDNPDAFANERAFPQLDNDNNPTNNSSFVEPQSRVLADYLPLDVTGAELPRLTAGELLARNLYCLMFRLIIDPEVDPANPAAELVPNFPYPTSLTTDVAFRNRYVAKRLAQWAVNVVDMRDTDSIMTMFRYDPNPFNETGFDLTVAQQHVVWGLERPEVGLTETLALHERRAKRNLQTRMDPNNPSLTPDGFNPRDEIPNWEEGDPLPDPNLDQFRIPEASAIVEIQSLREPHRPQRTIESYPSELYTLDGGIPKLDLGRVVGAGRQRSPVWRLAVGYTGNMPLAGPASPDPAGYRRSALWVNDAWRFTNAAYDESMPNPLEGYTANGIDDPNNPDGNWASRIVNTSEVTSPIGDNTVVQLYDDDLNPTNGSPSTVRLDRFVWFANLAPDVAGGLDVLDGPSGMRLNNVFFPTTVLGAAVQPLLPPAGHAVIMPREETVLGQTDASTVATGYGYSPSNQRFQVGPGPSFRYFNVMGQSGHPNYPIDNAQAYRINPILPIVAVSLPPHRAMGEAAPDYGNNEIIDSWRRYFDDPNIPARDRLNVPPADRVGVGFNVSAPLSGPNYYEAPTHRINSDDDTRYPKFDGYRDYSAGEGEHPDVPFDERPGAILREMDWLGVGTKQDVASIFLQRLADPTAPWDATFNPYITVDAMTIDLTVFNGEEDLRQEIDPVGDGNLRLVDIHTPIYPERVAFDTRRKIPDPELDRPFSQLVLNQPTTDPGELNDLENYSRIVYAHRSPLMTMQNMLRARFEQGGNAFFRHQLTSAWTNGDPAAAGGTESLHSGFRFDPTRSRFDNPNEFYPQTLGFVNREMGEPAQARTTFAGSSDGDEPGRYVGFPIAVNFNMPTWLDRPYQSPYEIMSVPATSTSGLAREFHPGTLFNLANSRETASRSGEQEARFNHLLGFEVGMGRFDNNDVANPAAGPAPTLNANTSAGYRLLTGSRAGFEQIFDLVDIGPLAFGQRRWFDPIQSIPQTSGTPVQNAMFRRVLQTLQPPFNYVDNRRTPGKINLNTMPDYVRRGGGYTTQFPVTNPDFQRPLKAGTAPQNPGQTNGTMNGITAEPTNHRAGTAQDPINQAILYGNGSVYRALTSGISTAYDLDDVAGEPVTMGQVNGYHRSTDSRFGYGFKGFIQSRRGYGTTFVNPNHDWELPHFLNIDLDFRYPSRFAGMFTPHAGSLLPSVQKYQRQGTDEGNFVTLRRTYDMSLLRPHPDFDVRRMSVANRNAADSNPESHALNVEAAPMTVDVPNLIYAPNAAGQNDPTNVAVVQNLRMPLVGTGVFERPQAELHKNFRNLDRDPFFRFKNVSQLAGMTTHHSNVFMVRFTVGFFHYDSATGAVGEEYVDPREGRIRPRAFYIVDRTIPTGYQSTLRLPSSNPPMAVQSMGQESSSPLDVLNTVIYSSR